MPEIYNFNKDVVDAVWKKYAGDAQFSKDVAGAWMNREKYGQTTHLGEGWEIDHIKPIAKGGTDDISNLRPLQWENNRSKSDNYPVWIASVSSEGTHNVSKTQAYSVN